MQPKKASLFYHDFSPVATAETAKITLCLGILPLPLHSEIKIDFVVRSRLLLPLYRSVPKQQAFASVCHGSGVQRATGVLSRLLLPLHRSVPNQQAFASACHCSGVQRATGVLSRLPLPLHRSVLKQQAFASACHGSSVQKEYQKNKINIFSGKITQNIVVIKPKTTCI